MVVVNYTQANTQLLIINLLFFCTSETSQIKGQDFQRVECQNFIRPTFFFLKSSIKYEQLAYSVHLPPFSVTAFPIEKKKVQFQNGLPLTSTASAPPRRYLNQSKATSFIR